jgi:methylenetetrahydrofolate dehydrogenase (NADP+) / methenyltetrahydrofolate cyclohydrolase
MMQRMHDPRLLDGRTLRDQILRNVAERVTQAAESRPIGRLVSVSIGTHSAASVYVRSQASARSL